MNYTIIIAFAYATIVMLGGLIGYIVAGSTPSLVAGLSLGLLFAVFTFLLQQGKPAGSIGTMVLPAAYGCFFLYRFMLSYKFMPAGMMLLISIAVFAIMFNAWQQQQHA